MLLSINMSLFMLALRVCKKYISSIKIVQILKIPGFKNGKLLY